MYIHTFKKKCLGHTYTKRLQKWNEEDVQNALAAVRNGASNRKAAAMYGMSEGKLRFFQKNLLKGQNTKCNSGKATALKPEIE